MAETEPSYQKIPIVPLNPAQSGSNRMSVHGVNHYLDSTFDNLHDLDLAFAFLRGKNDKPTAIAMAPAAITKFKELLAAETTATTRSKRK